MNDVVLEIDLRLVLATSKQKWRTQILHLSFLTTALNALGVFWNEALNFYVLMAGCWQPF
jgi:hypothetical protein